MKIGLCRSYMYNSIKY